MALVGAAVGYAALQAPATLPDIRTAVVVDAGRDAAFRMAMESLLDHGITPVASSPEQGLVSGERGVSAWSWGERVDVHLSGRRSGPTFLRVVSHARLATNLSAPDWSATLMADLRARALDPTGPGAPPTHGAAAHAACFAISPEGLLLTAHHVVAGAGEITVELADGRSLAATVESADQAVDLALLKVPAATPEFLDLAPGSPELGEAVFASGFATPSLRDDEPWSVPGTVSALSGPNDEHSLLQVAMAVRPKDVGGPLLNARGEVVGVLSLPAPPIPFLRLADAPPQDAIWAVKVGFARRLLADALQGDRPAGARPVTFEHARSALCLVIASVEARSPER